METLRGTVTELGQTAVTVLMDDGSTRVVDVPERIHVEIGMPVTIVDFGDGAPIYGWGD
jgi:hypothetical protein